MVQPQTYDRSSTSTVTLQGGSGEDFYSFQNGGLMLLCCAFLAVVCWILLLCYRRYRVDNDEHVEADSTATKVKRGERIELR